MRPRIGGVRVELPLRCRVEYMLHDDEEREATLMYDVERQDYVLSKLESVPGVREEWPLRGAPVAVPKVVGGTRFEARTLRWYTTRPVVPSRRAAAEIEDEAKEEEDEQQEEEEERKMKKKEDEEEEERKTEEEEKTTKKTTTKEEEIWEKCRAAGDLRYVGSRTYDWRYDESLSRQDVKFGRVTEHELVSNDLGGRGAWSIEFDDGTQKKMHAAELRCALDLRHHVECGSSRPSSAPGWTTRLSRSLSEYYHVQTIDGHARAQWEHPEVRRYDAPASCGCPGHRNRAHVVSHDARMLRKRALVAAQRAKLDEYRRETSAISYYEWCRARCRANLAHRQLTDVEPYVDDLMDRMRDYDRVASDSDFSTDDEEDDVDDYDDDDQMAYVHVENPRKRKQAERLVREGIEAYIDSPGVAARILHQDGNNRTRSGRVFGGDNALRRSSKRS